MSTIVKTKWLTNKQGERLAPKTLIDQVLNSDGTKFEDKLGTDLDLLRNDIKNKADADDITNAMSTHDSNVDAHSDIRTALDTHKENKNNPHEVTLGQLDVTVNATEINHLAGVESNIQTQIDGKSNVAFEQKRTAGSLIGTLTIDGEDTSLYAPPNTDQRVQQDKSQENIELPVLLGGSEVPAGESSTVNYCSVVTINPSTGALKATTLSGKIKGLNATINELNYMDGVTSNVQTQLDTKENKTTIIVDEIGGGKSINLHPSLTNTEWRLVPQYGIEQLNLNFLVSPEEALNSSSECYYSFIFRTADENSFMGVSDNMSQGGYIYYTGDDCEDGNFRAVANKLYDVGIWWNGYRFHGTVRGV